MFYEDNHIKIYNKDCRFMSELPDESVQCVVTSPPYWGLRKYSGEQELIWGGDKGCRHQWIEKNHKDTRGVEGSNLVGRDPYKGGENRLNYVSGFCSLCGCWRGSYGLEPTPEMYIEHTIEILREIRRVLRKDGVVFWNIGDSYNSGAAGNTVPSKTGKINYFRSDATRGKQQKQINDGVLKPKDLCLIPFRVAIAAQEAYQEFTIKELKDRAWLAGIVDADGTIGIHHLDRKTYHQFQPYVAVGSSDLPMIDKCVSITRCGGSRLKVEPNHKDSRGIVSNRTHYEWRLEGENATKVLEDIYPYLTVKEKQARVAHALWRNQQDTKELHKGKGHKTPDGVVRDRLALWELIKKCNQRESVEVNLPPVPQHIEPGWWVRSVIIWSKLNPMPESVTDRPTESHEYILMLTKSSRYYWDADAVREKQLQQSIDRMTRNHLTDYDPNYPTQGPQNLHFGEKLSREEAEAMSGRNIRSVWEFPTQPFPKAHFAVFPEKLPEICIKAATPEVGCCSKCGAPWERISEVQYHNQSKTETEKYAKPSFGTKVTFGRGNSEHKTLGWQPTCSHKDAPKVPSVCLDPFAGAGTTLWVAKKLNRRAVGYEISKEYCDLALDRNRQQVLC